MASAERTAVLAGSDVHEKREAMSVAANAPVENFT